MEKIEKTYLPDAVTKEIRDKIISKEWPVGHKLPSESSLAEMFGVNRLTVRLAINRLCTVGALETVNGLGTFVKEFDMNSYFEQAGAFLSISDKSEDFREFRILLETYGGSRIAARQDKEVIKRLYEIVDAYEESCRGLNENDIDKILEHSKNFEWEFHSTMVDGANNAVLSTVYSLEKFVLFSYIDAIILSRIERLGLRPFLERSFMRHRKQVEHMEHNDPQALHVSLATMTSFWEDDADKEPKT